jgi:hypothetical protein
VIGNADYPDATSPLAAALRNARAVADQLQKSGFEVDVFENLDKESLQTTVGSFYEKSNPARSRCFSSAVLPSRPHLKLHYPARCVDLEGSPMCAGKPSASKQYWRRSTSAERARPSRRIAAAPPAV